MGPYRILRLINRGGQGSVYLGYDDRLQRRVAIKIRSLPARRKERKRLLYEARAVANIHSPKVVQIHDVIESSEHLALVMEYVPGCDLEEFLRAQSPTVASILTIGADVAGALAAAQLQHIVHGDLKAGNILVSDSGRLKLTDFGIAHSGRGDNAQGLAAGSLSALSPEHCLGKPLDMRSDLFALGCLLYRMLTGGHPFVRGSQLDTGLLLQGSAAPLRDRLVRHLDVPDDLVSLIDQLLQADPDQRPDSIQQVRQQLRDLAREIPLAASDSLLQQARPYFRRESSDDIPLNVPRDLGRQGRSWLAAEGAAGTRFRQGFTRLDWRARAALALGLSGLIAIPLVIALYGRQSLVLLKEPVFRVASAMDMPREISGPWLAEEVRHALETNGDDLRLSSAADAAGGTTLYADGRVERREVYDEQLQVELRCSNRLCVFSAAREHADQRRIEQAVLLEGMPIGHWRDVVRGVALAVYR